MIKMENDYIDLCTKDSYILNLIEWMREIESLKDKVRQTEMDRELENELNEIFVRLQKELGMRTYLFLEEKINGNSKT